MSILGADANSISLRVLTALVIALQLGLPVAIFVTLRVYRPRTVIGPERLSRRQSPLPLMAAAGLGLLIWVMVQALYGDLKGLHAAKVVAGVPAPASVMSAGDWAFLATVPPLVAFATLWLADYFVGGFVLLDRFGFSLRRLFSGIAKGILAAIVILPATNIVGLIVEWIYSRFNYPHPMEHELLKVMGESVHPAVRWILILGAVLAAPLWEEFLFRAHIQTLLRRMLVTVSSPRLPGMEGLGGYAPMNVPINPNPIPFAEVIDPPPVWQTWAAIILTSCLFAMLHPMWMWPPIFFLSVGLGYCYERTGNLWSNMTVHCLFNSASTLLYLSHMTP